jgi:rare lipoprotein A (peptidoglycan hydrolase)
VTGRSAVVTLQDRGSFVKSHIVDSSPATARAVGIKPQVGVARVEVAPIAVPLPEGRAWVRRGGQHADREEAEASASGDAGARRLTPMPCSLSPSPR